MTTFLSKSIIIPTFQRPVFLKACLDSIFQQINEIEVIVIVNGQDLNSLELLKSYDVKVLTTNSVTPGEARNIAIKVAQGDIIGFLDDDIELSDNYFTNLELLIQKYPDADVLGGPDQTFLTASKLEKAIGITLTSPLATAKTNHRHLRGEVELHDAKEEHLILCNLWIKKAIFEIEKFYFDNRLYRNEENVLLHQLKNNNKQLIYSPNLYVFHHRKADLKKLIRAVSSSGYFRLMSFIYYPDQFSVHYLVPSIFLVYLILLVLLFPLISSSLFLLPLVLYVILNISLSIKLSINYQSLVILFRIIFIHFVINISYGVGFLIGSLKILSQSLFYKNIIAKMMRHSWLRL